ncbi:MAG: sulfate adenylyltransferase subunit CysN [Gemmatimonadota bacterium]
MSEQPVLDAEAVARSEMAAETEMDLLRFSTAGSVDDGKSTLIGRLLYDTKSIFQDQLEAVEKASRRLGDGEVNLALLTDGLRAEREQKITIDVAYRYFATPKRKFIIADTPGHIQYTRNMVTGASTAELAIVLIDARKGVLTQSKRHGFIASLLRIPHIAVAVNKMDLVDYDEAVYDRIVGEYREFAEKLDVKDLTFIPMSALRGDNVVHRSDAMPWFSGPTLLHHLENVNVGADRNLIDFRFPVQYVIRPHQDFRGFAGRVVSGTVEPGQEVAILPSGRTTRIREIFADRTSVPAAAAEDSVVITLTDEVDVSRGDMIVRRMNVPTVGTRFDAYLCWMAEAPLDPAADYIIQHTTRTVKARVNAIRYRIDVDTLHREDAASLELNDIARVELVTAEPIFFDPYQVNIGTGSFIVIDPFTNRTVGAGMIRGTVADLEEQSARSGDAVRRTSPNVVWEGWNIPREEREARNGHKAAVVWLTGLSGSGKTTIARAVERRLFEEGRQTMLLDGDMLRHGLNGDLGFSPADRKENIRRVGEVARLFFEQGSIVLCAFVSPYAADRAAVRRLFPDGRFFEVHVHCDVETLRQRDTKQLYAAADRGSVSGLTGVSSTYEIPPAPELLVETTEIGVNEAVAEVLKLLESVNLVP